MGVCVWSCKSTVNLAMTREMTIQKMTRSITGEIRGKGINRILRRHLGFMGDSLTTSGGSSEYILSLFVICLVHCLLRVKPCVEAALSAGYRMFDTAKYYSNEPELGDALKELLPKFNLKREDVFITTKFFPCPEDPQEGARKLVDESFKNLHTDYLDMVLIHYPKPDSFDVNDPRNKEFRKETYLALEKLSEEGKVHSVGVSNYEIKHLEEIKEYGKSMPCANQLEYHPHFVRQELHDYCKKEGIFFQAFSSLARHEPKLIEDPVVCDLAKKYNTTVPLLLLAFASSQGVGIVPKSATPKRIAENFKVVDLHLSPEDVKALLALDKGQHYIRCTGWLVV